MKKVGYLSLCQDMCQDARGLKRRFQHTPLSEDLNDLAVARNGVLHALIDFL